MWVQGLRLVLVSGLVTGCVSNTSWVLASRRVQREATERLGFHATPQDLPRTREEILQAVIARDPGMVARLERARSALEQAGVEASLPAPEASVQVWNVPFNRPWAFGDANMYMLELRQRFPAPGVLGARQREGIAMAEAALAELATRERELIRRAATAWAEHRAAAGHHRAHQAHLALLERMSAVARDRLAAGRGSLDDLTRLEAERARVLRLLARFDNDRHRTLRVLEVLVGRPLDALPEPPDNEALVGVALAPQTLVERALSRRGVVRAAHAALAAAREGARAAHVEATRPELMVGLSSWIELTQHNGYGAMAGMTLPWLWGPGPHRERAANARVRAEESALREVEDTVRGEVLEAHARMEGALRELALLEGDATRAAERALQAAQVAYVSGGSTLLAWLDAARMRLDLAVEAVDLRLELDRALEALDEAVGETLPRTRLEGVAP